MLGPTRELTDQILGVAKSMSHFAKFRSACVNGGVRSAVVHTIPRLVGTSISSLGLACFLLQPALLKATELPGASA